MRIGIYDPYLDTLGGGELYVLSIASFLSKQHQVEVFWDDERLLDKAGQKLDLDLIRVSAVKNIFSKEVSFIERAKKTKDYDVLFYVSDGSIPYLFSRKNFLIFQFPVGWVREGSVINRIKLKRVTGIICYSEFVKQHLRRKFKSMISVVNPPVSLINSKPSDKKNIILTVGRFTRGMNRKKHEVMVDVFKKVIDKGLKNWKFVIAGSHLPEDYDLVDSLKKTSKGYPIEIHANVERVEIENFYKQAKIYWHAAGFGENLDKHPEHAEHFGITTVEAMGAGVVPVVIKAGGQVEIVENRASGFLWSNLDELEKFTLDLINDKRYWEKMSENAKDRASVFSKEKFNKEIEELIK